MATFAWKLVQNGRAVEIYEVDPATRALAMRNLITFKKVMSSAEVTKFVEDHYPDKEFHEIRLAAETVARRK